ncbi:glycosyltransferase [Propioniciclava soli]|uniref:Glycosyltransferase n=1 Tax=Propioniciclava soli TaxID=2775081 RepID=A0ABZ3C2Y4_9ACTN
MTPPIRILLTIGTDMHLFARPIAWLDRYVADRPGLAELCVVQHGNSPAPLVAGGSAFIPYDELVRFMGEADVVITHGGPATIFEARGQGRVPVCVPRNPALGEHVDGHQQRFARYLAAKGAVLLSEDEETFIAHLDAILDDPGVASVHRNAAATAAAVSAVEQIVDDLVPRRTARPRRAMTGAGARA